MLCYEWTSTWLVCLTSFVLLTSPQYTSAFIFRGCAYRPVAGKQQAVLFCLAGNLCAMLYCRHRDVFSLDHCGCVPSSPSSSSSTPPLPYSNSDNKNIRNSSNIISGSNNMNNSPSNNNTDSGEVFGGGGAVTTTTAATTTTTAATSSTSSTSTAVVSSVKSSITLSALLSTGRSVMSTTTTTIPSADSCLPEIQIDGLSATSPSQGLTSTTDNDNNNNLFLDPRGVVERRDGWMEYNGYSYLSIPMYDNAKFHSGFSVSFVIEEGNSRLKQVLMTNCRHGDGASVEVMMNVEMGVIVFHVAYRFRKALNDVQGALTVTVPYTAFVRKRISMIFDGRYLTGRVNNQVHSARVQGNGDYVLSQRRKPIIFGNTLCDIDDIFGFRGQMRQISMYRCAKPITFLGS